MTMWGMEGSFSAARSSAIEATTLPGCGGGEGGAGGESRAGGDGEGDGGSGASHSKLVHSQRLSSAQQE